MNTNFSVTPRYSVSPSGPSALKGPAPSGPSAPGTAPPTSLPKEEVVLSPALRTPRAGSDMAQMLEDLQSQGVLPASERLESPADPPPVVRRAPSSDFMAQMVESLQQESTLGSQSLHVAVNGNGSIALLDDVHFQPNSLHSTSSAPSLQSPGSVPETPWLEGSPAQGHGHAHGHGFKEDGLLGGHIGTEVIEKIGHHAHHAASHGAVEAASHGAVKGAGQALAKSASQAASGAGGASAAEASGHGVAKLAAHGQEAAHEAASSAADLATAKTTGLQHASQHAHHLSAGLEVALAAGTVAAAALAVPLALHGAKELKQGIKEKDTERILEGAGGIAVGARSAGTAVVMGAMLTTSEVVAQAAQVAASTLTPLGVFHGAVDVFLGFGDIGKGKSTQGWLKVATGGAIGAAAIFGGLPLTLLAGGALLAKTGHKVYSHYAEKGASQGAPQSG